MHEGSRPRVYVTRQLPGDGFAALRDDPALDVRVWPNDLPPPPDTLRDAVRSIDGLLCLLTDRIDAALLDAAGPQLHVVSQMAVGVDNIDLAACAARGIPVGHTPGILTETTADLAFALLLAGARRLLESANDVRAGHWTTWSPEAWTGADVHGATLGLVGFGAIGQAVARRAKGFGMRVRYWSRTQKPEIAAPLNATYQPLPDLVAASDFVSLHVALNADTHHLIDAAALAQMPSHAWLINTARGGVVDESALIDALQSHAIGGAALDVTAVEPIPLDNPLLQLPNVIVLSHIGSASRATRARMADMAVANLRAGLRGESLPHAVTPSTK